MAGKNPGLKIKGISHLLAVLTLTVLFVFSYARADADPLDNWHWRNPLPQGNTLRAVTYGNNTFVAVGDYGTVLTTPDGTSWTAWTSGTSNGLYGVTFGNNTFVAVGINGIIVTSTDGKAWTPSTIQGGDSLYGVTYGNNTFVAVGSWGTILTSPNGTVWTNRSPGAYYYSSFFGVAYGNNTFVTAAVNGNGYGSILTSPDGIVWTARTTGSASYWFVGVTYGNNTFVAVGGYGKVLTSPDGAAWTVKSSRTSNHLSGVTYGNNTFVVVGEAGTILQYDPLDTTSPVVQTFTVPVTSSTLTVPVSAFTAADNVGGSGLEEYMITESSTPSAATDVGWSSTAPTSYTFTTSGSKTLYAWVKDIAGNVSAGLSASVDITIPGHHNSLLIDYQPQR